MKSQLLMQDDHKHGGMAQTHRCTGRSCPLAMELLSVRLWAWMLRHERMESRNGLMRTRGMRVKCTW
jgi:hypothetical protein